jgi:hypothetical protein
MHVHIDVFPCKRRGVEQKKGVEFFFFSQNLTAMRCVLGVFIYSNPKDQ